MTQANGLTQDHINLFNAMRKKRGLKKTSEHFAPIVKSLGLDMPGRSKAWGLLTAESKSEPAPQKKARKQGKTQIGKISDAIIASQIELSENSLDFLKSIAKKRKLTVKQSAYLKSLAAKAHVVITDEIAISGTKQIVNTYGHRCDHSDLGSIGYTHGTTVRCPHCGTMTNVW